MATRLQTFIDSVTAVHGTFLNDLQDMVAALADYAQEIKLAVLHIGEDGLALSKYGTAEAVLAGSLRVTKIVRALGGIIPPSYTTSARNALSATDAPALMIIYNSTTVQLEYNAGSGASPNWQPLTATAIANNAIVTAMINAAAVTTAKIANNAIVAALIDGTLKPSVSAAAGTEALRALGTTGTTAAAGNDSRLADTRLPKTPDVVAYVGTLAPGETLSLACPATGSYIIAWGAGGQSGTGQGSSCQLTCNGGVGGAVRLANIGDSGGSMAKDAGARSSGDTFTITNSSGDATALDVWLRLTRTI